MKQQSLTIDDAFSYTNEVSRHGDINDYLGQIIGPKFHDYRLKWEEVHSLNLETNFPLYLSLETLFKCNYRCDMCIYSEPTELAQARYPERMSDELFDRIISEATEFSCPSIGFNTVNEPLLDRDITRRVGQAAKAGFVDLRMNTNASLLTSEKSLELIDAGLVRLYVSIDASTAETYSKVRKLGDFDLVKKNVLEFLEIREKSGQKLPILRLSFVRLKANEQEIPDFLNYWTELADLVTIQEYMPPVINEEFKEKRARSRKTTKSYTCPQPYERLVIKGNGEVHPCCAQFNYKIKIGNLRTQSIYDLWNSSTMKELRGHMKDRTWDRLPICDKCIRNSYQEEG
tara:strand:+ start:125 stop:1156 length:1032 start_codon:yes stop_codon:yes gene_type:complete